MGYLGGGGAIVLNLQKMTSPNVLENLYQVNHCVFVFRPQYSFGTSREFTERTSGRHSGRTLRGRRTLQQIQGFRHGIRNIGHVSLQLGNAGTEFYHWT